MNVAPQKATAQRKIIMSVTRKILPVILCGGAGTRLWPRSREGFPKQFLPLLGSTSTFEETLRRVGDKAIFDNPMIVTSEAFRFIVSDQMHRNGVEGRIVLEPMRRDSGPAIAAAAEMAHAVHPETVLLILAADHAVKEADLFVSTVLDGLKAAEMGAIVTFGITPTHPATGYGYINPGEALEGKVRRVAAFVEKPPVDKAMTLVEAGCLWNSGNFMFRADVFLAELARFEPAIASAVHEAVDAATIDATGHDRFERIDPSHFAASPSKSVDYAVMERTDRMAVVTATYHWSDLGSFEALWEASPKDEDNNAIRGDATLVGTTNSYVSSDGPHIAVVGLSDIAVVATDDAVLVARRDVSGDMKTLVTELRKTVPTIVDDHSRVLRPWGWYQSVDRGERFQVKRLMVEPGKRLSLQKHLHRSEHWVVVRGTATVTVGETKTLLKENESIYIPLGAVHRLANEGMIPLELVEVQSGSYLGEDDIIRLADDFQRG